MKWLVTVLLAIGMAETIHAQDASPAKPDGPPPTDKSVTTTPPAAQPTPPQAQVPQIPQLEPAPAPARKRLHGSVYLFGSSANQIKFGSVTASGNGASASGNVNYNLATSGGLGAELSMSEPDSWGFSAGLTYDATRNVNSVDITLNGVNTDGTYSSSNPTLSFETIYANAIYRWGGLYLPFGLNYSFPTLTQGSGATGSLNITGGLGAQVGVGYHITDHFSVEALDRVVAFKMSGSDSSYNVDFGTGYMTGLQLNLKFDF